MDFSGILELNKFLVTPFRYPAPLHWTLRREDNLGGGVTVFLIHLDSKSLNFEVWFRLILNFSFFCFGEFLNKSNCQSIVIKLMNFPTLLTTTQNSNSLNQMSWYWCKKVKSCKKKIKSCLGAIVGHPPKNALYHTMQMVLVEPCDKLIICFLWVLKGGKHNYWWHMASIIMFTTL